MVGRVPNKLWTFITTVLFVSLILKYEPDRDFGNDISSVFVTTNIHIRGFPSRNSGKGKQKHSTREKSPSWKVSVGFGLVKLSLSASFLVLLSGDVSINPGPITDPCDICEKGCRRNQRAVQCDRCDLWFHAKCTGITNEEYADIAQPEANWFCTACLFSAMPFNSLGDETLAELINSSKSYFEDGDESEDDYANANANWRPGIVEQRTKDSRDILMMHLNVNSLQNKIEEVEMLIRQFKAQVLFLTETKIDASYPNSQFAVKNFHIYRNDRAKGGGGVMAYISATLPSKKLKLPRTNYKTIEPLAVQTSFGGKSVIVMGLYRPPKATGKDYYLRLEEELNDICSWMSLQNQFIVIMGDLNLDKLRPDQREGKILCDLEDIHGLECLIGEPTRITKNSSTLLDVILTNKPERFKDSGVYNPEISDHCMVYAVVKERTVQHKNKIVQVRSYKNLDEERFKEELSTAPWHVGEVFDSLDDRYGYWETLLNDIVDEHLPTKDIRVRAKDVPYMTREWKNAIKSKRRFSKKFSKNPTQENLELKRKWRNEATKQRRAAIKFYWKKVSDNIKSDPRKFYKTFTPFLDVKNKQADKGDICLKINDKLEADQSKVAEHLAHYFSTIADGIGGDNVDSLTEEDFKNHKSVEDISKNIMNVTNDQFEFTTLSSKEIQDTLEKLNPNKATGYDNIESRILKIGAKELAPSLAGILNPSIRNGLWVTQWKQGEWIPVFKKDDRQKDANYRPITVLPCVDKVYEKLLGRQISEFMDVRLNEAITAYRPQNGCETTLLRLVENWKEELDRKKYVGVLSSDMSKAFDSLYPPLLISKLKAYKFSENSIDLIRSYFDNRKNRVRMGTTMSEWKPVGKGCPQGSTFGPLMWNIFQNDLPRQIVEAYISMYADDHQIYVASESCKILEEKLIENGERMTKWYVDNMLQVNFDKYQCMVLGHKNKERTVNISIEGENIEQSQSIKILGVCLDEQLNFSQHISEICKRVSKQVGVLSRLRNLIPSNAKLHLYKSAILPHLTYCHLVWHFSKASDRRKLERLQERALRAVYNNKSDTYGSLLKKANLTTLYDRRLQDILILMFKVKNGLTPRYIRDLFQIHNEDRRYNLRNSDFKLPSYNTVTYGKHSIKFLGPLLWAKLTKEERNIKTLTAFKTMIRKKDISAIVDGCGRDCYLCQS